MTLDELGILNGTDKASVWAGEPRIIQGYPHRYLPFYEQFLAPLRYEPLTLLEFGVERGASLKMWRDYFLKARIIGVDKNPVFDVGERIEVVQSNQHNREDLERISGKYGMFDIVIDDAGHDPDAQIFCFEYMVQQVKPGGFYILEDVAENEKVILYLCKISANVMTSQAPMIDSISFSYGTTVIKRR